MFHKHYSINFGSVQYSTPITQYSCLNVKLSGISCSINGYCVQFSTLFKLFFKDFTS